MAVELDDITRPQIENLAQRQLTAAEAQRRFKLDVEQKFTPGLIPVGTGDTAGLLLETDGAASGSGPVGLDAAASTFLG